MSNIWKENTLNPFKDKRWAKNKHNQTKVNIRTSSDVRAGNNKEKKLRLNGCSQSLRFDWNEDCYAFQSLNKEKFLCLVHIDKHCWFQQKQEQELSGLKCNHKHALLWLRSCVWIQGHTRNNPKTNTTMLRWSLPSAKPCILYYTWFLWLIGWFIHITWCSISNSSSINQALQC